MKFLRTVKDRWSHSYALAGAMLAMMPMPAWAQAANQTEVETMANAILNFLTGPIAKAIAAVAVVIAGYMFFVGNGNKGTLVSIIIGCFIIFGAGWLVDTISGT